MTKEEAEKLYNENCGELKLQFSSYWKYEFSFNGSNEKIRISVSAGGNADDIYRFSVEKEPFDAPKTFSDLMKNYYLVLIEEKSTGLQFHDYHY